MDYTKFNDQTLLQLITHAHENALSELYNRYGRLVFSVAVNAVGDSEMAEEITQDVFLRVWDKADTYMADQGKVVTWLARIARNRSIDIFRRRSVRAEGHSSSWAEVEASDLPDPRLVEERIELSQRQQWVRQAISQLPEEQKTALRLAYFKGYSHPQIAEALGEPLGTVKTRIRLAMQKLAKLLSDEADVV